MASCSKHKRKRLILIAAFLIGLLVAILYIDDPSLDHPITSEVNLQRYRLRSLKSAILVYVQDNGYLPLYRIVSSAQTEMEHYPSLPSEAVSAVASSDSEKHTRDERPDKNLLDAYASRNREGGLILYYPINRTFYILASRGPNEVFDISLEVLTQLSSDEGLAVKSLLPFVFDATNGAVSSGDIAVFGEAP